MIFRTCLRFEWFPKSRLEVKITWKYKLLKFGGIFIFSLALLYLRIVEWSFVIFVTISRNVKSVMDYYWGYHFCFHMWLNHEAKFLSFIFLSFLIFNLFMSIFRIPIAYIESEIVLNKGCLPCQNCSGSFCG